MLKSLNSVKSKFIKKVATDMVTKGLLYAIRRLRSSFGQMEYRPNC